MSHVTLVQLLTVAAAAAAAGAVTWLVSLVFGTTGRLVMVLLVPVLSFFFVWPIAHAVVDPSCTYECDSATVLGALVLAGALLGIAVGSIGFSARERRRLRS